ncbi:MAG: hypothetical protein QNL91_03535 [Candidatus Krumholzibacteria bacterium]|nr:hypothetical protein [Candidatus Krumholzibacteria bacterium]
MTTRTSMDKTLPAGLILLTTVLLATAGCDINSPEMPSFDTKFVVPLGTERFEIMDAVDDEDYLLVGDDGSLGFHLDGAPDTLALDFDLTVDITGQSIDQGLGNFDLPPPAPLAYDFQLGDIWAPAAGLTGFNTIVPAFPIDVASSGQDLPDMTSATLSEGILTVTVTNNLAVPVGANSGTDQIILRLENPADSSLVVRVYLPVIPAGETRTQVANLAGVVLPDQVAARLHGGSPGSSGQFVVINGTNAIAVEAAFAGLVVSAATAVVGNQTFNSSFDSALPADYEITRAVIQSGSMDIDLTNGMPIPCTAYLSWDQVRNIDGLPLVRTFDLPAGGSSSSQLDFAGYTVQSNGLPLTSLSATINIVTPGSSGVPVTLTAGDGLTASLSSGVIAFSSVTGVVPAYEVPLDPITESIDLPDEMSGLELTAANLTLTLTNSSGIPADVDLTLTGTAAGGTTRSIVVNEQLLPAIGRAAATTTIVLDQANSGILDFLNNLPESITLDGNVIAGGSGEVGTVHADDFAVVGWDISAPVEVVITGATLDSDPEAVDIDTDLAERIATHARGAVLHAEILNHLPMGVQLRIVAAQDTNQLDTNPLLIVGPISIAAALTDPLTHAVSEAVTSTPTISLTEAEARVLGLPGLFTRVEAVLPSTNGQPVRVMSTDFLEFRGVVELEVLIDDEL